MFLALWRKVLSPIDVCGRCPLRRNPRPAVSRQISCESHLVRCTRSNEKCVSPPPDIRRCAAARTAKDSQKFFFNSISIGWRGAVQTCNSSNHHMLHALSLVISHSCSKGSVINATRAKSGPTTLSRCSSWAYLTVSCMIMSSLTMRRSVPHIAVVLADGPPSPNSPPIGL